MDTPMKFWGVEVKVGQSVKVDPNDQSPGYIHISQVALGEVKKDKATEPVVLYLKIGDRKFVLGTLNKDSIPQIAMDIVIDDESELSHNSKNASVCFSGFRIVCDSDASDSEPEIVPLMDRAQDAKEAAKSGTEDESDSDFSQSQIPIGGFSETDTDDDSEESESDEETPAKKVKASAINSKIESDSSDTDTSDSDSDEETPAKKVEASTINSKIESDSSDTDTSDSDSDEETPAKKVEASTINSKIESDSSDTDTSDSDSDEETPAKKVEAPQASAPKNATHGKIDTDTSDSDTTDSSDEETPTKRVDQGKNGKRRNEAGSQTPVPTKKAKNITPEKTDDKKGVHIATPHL